MLYKNTKIGPFNRIRFAIATTQPIN